MRQHAPTQGQHHNACLLCFGEQQLYGTPRSAVCAPDTPTLSPALLAAQVEQFMLGLSRHRSRPPCVISLSLRRRQLPLQLRQLQRLIERGQEEGDVRRMERHAGSTGQPAALVLRARE